MESRHGSLQHEVGGNKIHEYLLLLEHNFPAAQLKRFKVQLSTKIVKKNMIRGSINEFSALDPGSRGLGSSPGWVNLLYMYVQRRSQGLFP